MISWHYLAVFWMCLPPTHSFTPSFFDIWKVFRRMSGPSFIYVSFISSSRVFKFQMFSYQQKVLFLAASGWFFGGNPLECGQISFIFWPPMQCKVMHHIPDSFYSILNMVKIGPKNWFFCSFLVVFSLWPFTPYHLRSYIAKLKFLLRYIIEVSFIGIEFVVAKLWIFKWFHSSKRYHCRLLLRGFS